MTERVSEARILWRLLLGQPRQGTHAERLQAFYAPQASRYDRFRARLLQGREDLLVHLAPAPGEHLVELGCGTGSSLERLGPMVNQLACFDLVDLCPALLVLARQRATGCPVARVSEADARHWQPAKPVDAVFLSYALSMMPDWPLVLANAYAMLRPGGRIGLVDFYLPGSGSPWANALWRRWFAHDGVHLSAEQLPALRAHFVEIYCAERRARLPYLPGVQAPYYLFVGRKPAG
ncbi:MAG: class I SAM-dependent methyltransferase [Dechloromonas sp.]|nr:class I SAM-dependent methyltransferase [Dechloromonas sp.]